MVSASSVYRLHGQVGIVGWACRLPGANSVEDLWSLLLEGRCAVSQVPPERFSLDRFYHPRRQERGKSYTWAAGLIDDVWGFDPAVFGISPREAVQIDPQQRILLQLVWEALEDAGVPPSSLSGAEVGVYIGASQTDYGHAFYGDPAIADAHFAPGTAVAILANRISYIYGFHGPSVTVDTACSSSLVALHQAVEALQAGRIDTAIVGGTNLIASPASFVAFSQANLLSPTGLCQAFSATADGFVRAEGAVVFVLRKVALANARKNPIRGLVLASDVNSDGRTNGIALPSMDAQEALLERIYARNDIDPDQLAFVEAHGTGTPVGDPAEATAIGRSLGQKRTTPLPIGSIKTNIGHLEPASGLAGVLKALLALNHGILPPSLHFSQPNPHIPFDELNISVCTQSLLLPKSNEQYAGVNSFGFGGTNAHAVLAPGQKPISAAAESSNGSCAFTFSANSHGALVDLAREYADRVSQLTDDETAELAAAIVHRRERLPHRVVISSTRSCDVSEALTGFLSGAADSKLATGTAVGADLPIAFVYSGNGSQWAGMGVAAYQSNPAFRARFDQVDSLFKQIGEWSLKDALFSETLKDRLPLTSVAQPLIFAIQSAATVALRAAGLRPAAVLGHSVGEVAAAEAAGILDLRTAVKVVFFRSMHQELVSGAGRMLAALATPGDAQMLMHDFEGVEIAAINGPRGLTLAGPSQRLAEFRRVLSQRGIACVDLGLNYPFHTALMTPVEIPLKTDLRDMKAYDAAVPFVSTVAGKCLPGPRLDANYWWRNIREPVQFATAVQAAADLGARYFIEIGPRPTLLKHISDSLQGQVNGFTTAWVLDRRNETDTDPVERMRADAMVAGARFDYEGIFGSDPGPAISLPGYPWQQTSFRFKPTVEAIDHEVERHAFAGARLGPDALVWNCLIDTALYPELLDHKLGEQVIFPGTGFIEIGFAVAREWLKCSRVTLSEFQILSPLDLSNQETREVMTRVSPGTNTIEIFSRARLSSASWVQHCRLKAQSGPPTAAFSVPAWPGTGELFDQEKLYAIATGSGLNYGAAFQFVQSVTVADHGRIAVELSEPPPHSGFSLDPMRLDASAHGFFALFPKLRTVERGVAYIPVRLDEIVLCRPNVPPKRALIKVLSTSERSVVGDCYIFGDDNGVVAVLRGVRTQVVATRRTMSIETSAFIETLNLIGDEALLSGGLQAAAGAIAADAERLGLTSTGSEQQSEFELLADGWATAFVYELARRLSRSGVVDVERLLGEGRLSEDLRGWLLNCLESLEAAGLVKRQSGEWIVVNDSSLPSSTAVVRALATECQPHAAEAVLAAAYSGLIGRLDKGSASSWSKPVMTNAVLDFHSETNLWSRRWSENLFRLLQSKQLWPGDRRLRILQIGVAPLTQLLLSSEHQPILTLYEPDRRLYENAELAFSRHRDLRLLDDSNEFGRYDLIVSVGGLHRLPTTLGLADLKDRLSAQGTFVAIEPKRSLFLDVIFGGEPDWFSLDAMSKPVSRLGGLHRWTTKLEQAGFVNVEGRSMRSGSVSGLLLLGESDGAATNSLRAGDADPMPDVDRPFTVLLSSSSHASLGEMIGRRLTASGSPVSIGDEVIGLAEPAPRHVVLLPEIVAENDDPVAALTERCLRIKACAEAAQDAEVVLWLLFSGALSMKDAAVDPVETGAWAFSRTLANEFPRLDVRRIDIDPRLSAAAAAGKVHQILLSGTNETELHVDAESTRAVRVRSLQGTLETNAAPSEFAARLDRRSSAGHRLVWEPIERVRPGKGELEIEVEATGLNFRDLMWSMSLLPEDMLEDGFTGPTLGLECAGRVVAVGPSVKGLMVGDRVMAFAASSFSTHVTVRREQVMKLPDAISCEAAATIPVAFFTAYYSLVTRARLARREWVLIHGAAGAVGMAAIQIARARGARVIATAGSTAKRDLLTALGVAYVLDSRSTSFVDAVRNITGAGVHVVLNSLAGEAMERSIACLRPFGRFVELGKRDYVSNTHVGLRPFRKNLSYFGVDVDQVIAARQSEGTQIFRKIVEEFENGRYVPLPYSVFDADNVTDAFHLMQVSGHVGKILVRPPTRVATRAQKAAFQFRAEGTHVITGAFGGFGLETAKWLVDKGVRHLVMIGRRGAHSQEAQTALQDFERLGVKVLAASCDVNDRAELERLYEHIHATLPPIAGVMHAAMVLDDAALVNLDAARFAKVLAPKVGGVENLQYLLRGEPLDYFVMFSSVTTLVGNPGQANYVAANAYMEGVARRRRQQGLPALAIGWGPITDVGVLARNQKLQAGLQKLVGVTGMRAREALELLDQALDEPSSIPQTAVITIAPNDSSFTSDRLAVLKSPTYAAFTAGRRGTDGTAESIDLQALAATEGLDATRRKVASLISLELAHVLHLREEDISHVRPMGEIGLDSLMALELVMNLEQRFGLKIPLSGSSGAMTISDITNEVIAHVGLAKEAGDVAVETMAEQHHGGVQSSQTGALKEVMSEEPPMPKRLLQ